MSDNLGNEWQIELKKIEIIYGDITDIITCYFNFLIKHPRNEWGGRRARRVGRFDETQV